MITPLAAVKRRPHHSDRERKRRETGREERGREGQRRGTVIAQSKRIRKMSDQTDHLC